MPAASNTKPRNQRSAARKRRGIGRPAGPQDAVGRDALIAKTCELLRELPPDKVTRAAVARALRVDPSLIRYYFRDRSTLLQAAIERVTSEFVDLVEEATDRSDNSPIGQLRARMAAQLKLNATYPFFHRLIVDEMVGLDTSASRKLLQQLSQRGLDQYSAIINRGAADGSMKPVDARLLFLAIIGMCEFFVSGMPVLQHAFERRNAPDRALADRYRDFICELVLHGIATG
ncbi:MAG: TetR family transcriptional regulator C-terminal domain-containing protein [Steroidobacteraceae bacterium]